MGISVRTLPIPVFASTLTAAFSERATSMLPAEVCKVTSPGTGSGSEAVIEPAEVLPVRAPVMFSKVSLPPLVFTSRVAVEIAHHDRAPGGARVQTAAPFWQSMPPPLVATVSSPAQVSSEMLPPLVRASRGPVNCANFNLPPLVSAVTSPVRPLAVMLPPRVRSSALKFFGTRTV